MRQQIALEINCCNRAVVQLPRERTGWGEDGSTMLVEGQVGEIKIIRNGEAQFSIRIGSDGDITITDYASMNFRQYVPQNVQLIPSRPWKPETQPDVDVTR